MGHFHFSTDSSECPQNAHMSTRTSLGNPQDTFSHLSGQQKWFETVRGKFKIFMILCLKTAKTTGNRLKVSKMKNRENSIFRTPF